MAKETKKAKTEVKVEGMSLVERKHDLDALVVALNECLKKGDNLKDIAVASENVAAALAIYNEELRKAEYDKWLATDTPVLNALKQGDVEQWQLKNKKVEDGMPEQKELSTKNVLVDLVELSKHSGTHGAIFVSGQWIHKCEAFGKTLTEWICESVETASDVKKSVANKYAMSDEAMSDDIHNIPKKTSKTSLKKAGQMICDEIIGGYAFKGKDLEYIRLVMTRQSSKKRGTLTAPRKETVIKMITEVMVRIVNEREYDVEFKATK